MDEVDNWILIGEPSRKHPGIHCKKYVVYMYTALIHRVRLKRAGIGRNMSYVSGTYRPGGRSLAICVACKVSLLPSIDQCVQIMHAHVHMYIHCQVLDAIHSV